MHHTESIYSAIAAGRLDQFFGRYRKVLLSALISGFVLVVAVLWLRTESAEQRALQRIPANDRAALFAQTLREAELLCATAASQPDLRDRCADTATFLLAFPECDSSCTLFAHHYIRHPAR